MKIFQAPRSLRSSSYRKSTLHCSATLRGRPRVILFVGEIQQRSSRSSSRRIYPPFRGRFANPVVPFRGAARSGAARSGARQPVERLAGRCGGRSCRFLSLAENRRVLLARKKTLCSVFRSSRRASATRRDETSSAAAATANGRRRAANLQRRVQS